MSGKFLVNFSHALPTLLKMCIMSSQTCNWRLVIDFALSNRFLKFKDTPSGVSSKPADGRGEIVDS